jgi:hypothetical protein
MLEVAAVSVWERLFDVEAPWLGPGLFSAAMKVRTVSRAVWIALFISSSLSVRRM